MDIIQLMTEQFEYVNNTEKEIMTYIIQNGKSIKNKDLQLLASEMFLAPNTITRLCKKIGLNGYGELRLKLKEHFGETKEEVKAMTIEEQLYQTQQLISEEQIQSVVEMLQKAQKVVVYAVGGSRNVAEYFVTFMQFIGMQAYSFIDPHVMRINAENLETADVAFVISASGETISPKQAMMVAKTRGASIVTLTGHTLNSIAAEATVALYADVTERYYHKFDITNRFSMQYIINIIVERLIEQMPDNKM